MNPLPPGYYGQAVLTIQNALVQQHFGPFLAHLPPRRHTPERFLATAKLGQLLEREFKNVALLLGRAAGGVFVGIAVKPAADQSRLPTTRYPEPSVGRGDRTHISWPASRTMAISFGNVSKECPGINHVVLMPYLSNNLSRRGLPTSPANMPRLMSPGESSPPYEPSLSNDQRGLHERLQRPH